MLIILWIYVINVGNLYYYCRTILWNNKKIGSIYLTFKNTIGINLFSNEIKDYIEAISIIIKSYRPLEGEKSLSSEYFHVNINPSNLILEKALIEMGMIFIQKTYILNYNQIN